MITPYNFSIYDTTTWILDIESPINICNSLQRLQVSRRIESGERFLNVRNESQALVLALETISLYFESCTVILNDYHFCPSFLVNIISVGLMAKDGYELSIKNDICKITLNGSNVMFGQVKNGVYILSHPVIVLYIANKCPRLDKASDIYL